MPFFSQIADAKAVGMLGKVALFSEFSGVEHTRRRVLAIGAASRPSSQRHRRNTSDGQENKKLYDKESVTMGTKTAKRTIEWVRQRQFPGETEIGVECSLCWHASLAVG